MEESQIMNRITEIMNEYACLPQMAYCDLTLEAVGCSGDVRVKIVGFPEKKNNVLIERLIQKNESLAFIGDTFNYPNTLTSRSKMFSADGLKEIHFDKYGYLVATHDNSEEIFKVSSDYRNELEARLKAEIGDKLNKPINEKNVPMRPTEIMFKLHFKKEDKWDYIIVSGDSLAAVRKTAYDIIDEQRLDFTENCIYSERIKS